VSSQPLESPLANVGAPRLQPSVMPKERLAIPQTTSKGAIRKELDSRPTPLAQAVLTLKLTGRTYERSSFVRANDNATSIQLLI
jgi:hypothetical protein